MATARRRLQSAGPEDASGRPVPLCEIDLNAVRKKAVTNAQNRAVKAILGLGGLSWVEMRGAQEERRCFGYVHVPEGCGVREGCR